MIDASRQKERETSIRLYRWWTCPSIRPFQGEVVSGLRAKNKRLNDKQKRKSALQIRTSKANKNEMNFPYLFGQQASPGSAQKRKYCTNRQGPIVSACWPLMKKLSLSLSKSPEPRAREGNNIDFHLNKQTKEADDRSRE